MASTRSSRRARAPIPPPSERPDATEDVFAPNPDGELGKTRRGKGGGEVAHRTAADKKPGIKVPRRNPERRGVGRFERETMKTGRASGASPRAAQKSLPRKSVAAKRAAKKEPPTLPPVEDAVIEKRLKRGKWRPTSRYSEGR